MDPTGKYTNIQTHPSVGDLELGALTKHDRIPA